MPPTDPEPPAYSSADYRAILDTIPTLVWLARPDGRIEYANRRCQEYAGLPIEGLLEDAWRYSVHPEDLPQTLARWEASVLSGDPHRAVFRLRRHDGVFRWFDVAGELHRDGDGRGTRWYGTCTDIDDRFRLEERERQAQRMDALGRLAGGVAEDFRELLATVDRATADALSTLDEHHPARPQIGAARHATEEAGAVVRQLLAFGRRQVLRRRAFDLNALVADHSSLLRRLAGPGVDVVLTAAPSLPACMADPDQLGVVLITLAANARDAMNGGGRLTVGTRAIHIVKENQADGWDARPGPYVVLTVSDTGPGMTDEERRRLFEPFAAAVPGRSATPLGLAQVYGIVTQSGGHVAVDGGPSRGTTVRVYLPAVGSGLPPPTKPARTADGVRAGRAGTA